MSRKTQIIYVTYGKSWECSFTIKALTHPVARARKHFIASFSLDEKFYDDKWQKYSTFHCETWEQRAFLYPLYMCTEGRSYLPLLLFRPFALPPSPRTSGSHIPPTTRHPCLQLQTKSHPTTLKIEHKFDLYRSRNFSSTSERNVTFFREKRIRTLNSGRHIWVWNRLCSVLGPLGRWNITPSVWGYGPYEKHIFQITTMRKENIQMKILRYALGAAAWKILRGGRVLLNDIFRHTLLLFLTHSSDIGYPFVVYQKHTTH